MSDVILHAMNLEKEYRDGKLVTPVIKGLDFELKTNEKVAIVGSSGSGKSTLLHLLAGLDTPTGGEVGLMGQDFSRLSEVKRGRLRNEYMGFVYQFHFLLPELSALENTMLPLRVARKPAHQAQQEAEALLERVGLSHRMAHKPAELSGGERQRVAIARALITRPACVLADEPTGNLDETSAQQVFDLMLELNQELETALLVVTHDLKLAAKMDRQYQLTEGHFVAPDLGVTSA
ncbi:lipoprotein-releasing ABC transporter ATP-binding protein LolD [Hydrogenovibrio thermophilus]|jgi:lipoprotein-releasing system ATP-binding protein|uniref:Lipoprotein-releasing system ATP-binding protein LolD n=1 Tax=Hydrogenovibrio thermophilus TaxID=265883 RepID=A0A410H332_9GAMM|nr:lipoprotein-releasing ABC transporter ATP-binding protein LolD [Hydrogenovibrio thermophilus]QAB15332.1 lipoprotein-releasing ABC transporter ATP-binding protein LolD [Hydrogenovibrio thermophilus]